MSIRFRGAERQPSLQVLHVVSRVVAAVTTVLSALIVAGHSAGPIGHTVSVAFVVLMPAFAIAGLLPRLDGVAVALVSGAGAVVINTLVAQSMLSMNAWSRQTGIVVVGCVTASLWLLASTLKERSLTRGGIR
jgi:hypothetical protein